MQKTREGLVPAVFVARGKANMLRTAALLSAVASVTAFAPRVPRAIARTALNAAEEEDAPAFLANAEVVILHRSKSSLAAVAYELAAALEGLDSVGVGVATDGDGDDAAALRAVEGVRTVTPADGLSGYDDALAKLFAQGDSSRRRILVDASSTTAEAAADRAQAAKNLNVDAFCVVGDALTADDGAGTRGLLDSAMPVLAPGLETAVKTVAPDFPGGASVVRCEVVLGARGADESYAQGNHPLVYFFDRFARNRMAPVPGPGPRAGGPTMLVGAARAADVAKLVEAVLATKTSSVVTAGPVRPHDLAPATYTQLARACAFACGVDRARLPLYAPGNGWRERVGVPLADAPRREPGRRYNSVDTDEALRLPEAHQQRRGRSLISDGARALRGSGRLLRRMAAHQPGRRGGRRRVLRGRRGPRQGRRFLAGLARLHARRQVPRAPRAAGGEVITSIVIVAFEVRLPGPHHAIAAARALEVVDPPRERIERHAALRGDLGQRAEHVRELQDGPRPVGHLLRGPVDVEPAAADEVGREGVELRGLLAALAHGFMLCLPLAGACVFRDARLKKARACCSVRADVRAGAVEQVRYAIQVRRWLYRPF